MPIHLEALVMIDPEWENWVNPSHVVSVTPNSITDDRVRVELSTGRSFLVNGSAREVVERLNARISDENQ